MGDLIEHREGMAFIVRIFESRNHGLRRSDNFGKFRLAQSRFCASVIDKLCDVGIDRSLFAQVSKLSIAANNAVDDFHAVGCFSHCLTVILYRCELQDSQ